MEEIKKLLDKKEFMRAKELMGSFLRDNPDNVEAQKLMGEILFEMKEYQNALPYLKNTHSQGHLGACYYYLKDWENAQIHLISSILEKYDEKYAKLLEKALLAKHNDEAMLGLKLLMCENNPEDIYILRDITNYAQKLKKFDIAVKYFKILLALSPNDYVAWNNLGLIYEELNEWHKSYNCYKKALSLKDFFSPNFNLGIMSRKLHRFKDSITFLKKAVIQNPKSPQPKYSLAMSYMMLKDFKSGYPLYCRHMSIIMPYYYRNEWNGIPQPDKTLCIFTTGGLGDMIMYARYFEYLKGLFKKIYILLPKTLHSIFKRSYPDFEVLDSNFIFSDYDFAITPMHILKFFNLDFNNFVPQREGFLKADEAKTENFKKEFFSHNKLKIAINWHGNREGTRTFFNRTMPIENFEPIFEKYKDKAVFYSVQKDESHKQCAKYTNVINLYNSINDFDDTAAILKNTDLLISVDSSPVHMAGALGVKTYVLLPYANEWRWFIDDKNTIWYSSVSLFRQNREGDWASAVNKVLELF